MTLDSLQDKQLVITLRLEDRQATPSLPAAQDPGTQPAPQPPGPAPAVSELYDTHTRGALLKGYDHRIDPVGEPTFCLLAGQIGIAHSYGAPYGLTRGSDSGADGHCLTWEGAIFPEAALDGSFQAGDTGEFEFRLAVKDAGYLILDGHSTWDQPRLGEVTDNYIVPPTIKRQLICGRPCAFEACLSNQNSAGEGLELRWRGPGITVPADSPDGFAAIPVLCLHPPQGWQTQQKEIPPTPVLLLPPTPTPSGPPQFIPPQPDWASYATPDLPPGTVLFPPGHYWSQKVSDWPVDPSSAQIMATLKGRRWHPGFGQGGSGIPFNLVPPGTPSQAFSQIWYRAESDLDAFPIPVGVVLENGGVRFPQGQGDGKPVWDVHMLLLDLAERKLYEAYQTEMDQDAAGESLGTWRCESAAVFALDSLALRTEGATSADASGMNLLGGLVRWQEVREAMAAGTGLSHALRISVPVTRKGYVHPATHFTRGGGNLDTFYPPMGLRLRMRRDSLDLAKLSPVNRVLAITAQERGMIVADNGGPFVAVMGCPDFRWSDEDLGAMKTLVPDVSQCCDALLLGPVLQTEV